MQVLADAGYHVIAPNHKDSIASGHRSGRPQVPFGKPNNWDEATYKDRGEDIKNLLNAIRNDPEWQKKVDFSKVALMGHSLGGYTMLGLSGAWPSWKIDGIRAVIALSPYAHPYVAADTLKNVDIPVMYQCGTVDFGVTPFLIGENGAFAKTNSPAYLVEIKGANHFTWTVLNRQKEREDVIDHYCLAFLNKYVLEDPQAKPEERQPGIAELYVK
jgi:predicted dienelactone hydrolase